MDWNTQEICEFAIAKWAKEVPDFACMPTSAVPQFSCLFVILLFVPGSETYGVWYFDSTLSTVTNPADDTGTK
jgi:hypothetical protein